MATIITKLLNGVSGFCIDRSEIAINSWHTDCALIIAAPISNSSVIKSKVRWSATRIGLCIEGSNFLTVVRVIGSNTA